MSLIFIFLLSMMLNAANEAALQTTVSSQAIHIGDIVILTLSVKRPTGSTVKLPELETVLKPFVIKNQKFNEKKMEGNFIQTTLEYEITAFEIGRHELGPIVIGLLFKNGKKSELTGQPITIEVQSLLPQNQGTLDVRGPKPVLSIRRSLWPWVIALSILFVSMFLIVFIVKRLTLKEELGQKSAIIQLSPEEEALDAVEALLKSDELRQKRMKMVYSQLSFILRRFLTRRYLFDAMEMTSEECLKVVRERIQQGPLYASVRKLLNLSDLVKFAKFTPEPADAEVDLRVMKEIIQFSRGAHHEV